MHSQRACFPHPLANSVRRVFPSTASNGTSSPTFVIARLIRTPSQGLPPYGLLRGMCDRTVPTTGPPVQRPLARRWLVLSACLPAPTDSSAPLVPPHALFVRRR